MTPGLLELCQLGSSDRCLRAVSRGLDYYTGVIYEVILVGENVGAIAAGGRYLLITRSCFESCFDPLLWIYHLISWT